MSAGLGVRRDPWILCGGGALVIVALYWASPFFHDDAFISLRYAQRWLDGLGLSWTDGAPVEGYTHPLWLLQVTLLGRLGFDLEFASRMLGAAYLAGFVVLWWQSRLWRTPLFALLLSPALAIWSLSGLETVSFAFWCVLGVRLAWQASDPESHGTSMQLGCGLALAAAALTRPEGAAVGAIAAGWVLSRRRDLSSVLLLAAFATPVAVHQIWRLLYFGEWFPNTAFAKLGGLPIQARFGGALDYVVAGTSLWLPVVVALAWGLSMRPRSPAWLALVASSPIVLSCALAGGDHMQQLRLLVPVLALGFLALAWLKETQSTEISRSVVLLVWLCVGWNALELFVQRGSPARDLAAEMGEPAGIFFDRFLPDGSLVALATAGSTPYFAPRLNFIDTLGLNDYEIARRSPVPVVTKWQRRPGHLKGDGVEVLSRSPDVIVLGPANGFAGCKSDFWFLTDYELVHLPGFRRNYELYEFQVPIAHFPPSPTMRRYVKGGRFLVRAYLRSGSANVGELRAVGRPGVAPWNDPACS